ncbi:MAG: nucleoside-diphosphate kinase [Lentisphaeria bacterium]|nr:nucleoside-diphosphate kinase [Lentisphaeria bacterium]
MAQKLSYVLITPYSLMKSRAGGIIARLLSGTELELAGAQVFAPTAEFAQAQASSIRRELWESEPFGVKLFSDYIRENFIPLDDGTNARMMILLFRGENVSRKLLQAVGELLPSARTRQSAIIGETIRDIYGDLVFNRDGSVDYFEPAVIMPFDDESALSTLEHIADFLEKAPNIVENTAGRNEEKTERTIVLVRPRDWRKPTAMPGNLSDMISRTGLRLVGCKIHGMNVKEALELYAPMKEKLRGLLAEEAAEEAEKVLNEHFGFSMGEGCRTVLRDVVGVPYADEQYKKIIQFMSGCHVDALPANWESLPRREKCLVLVFEGENAVSRIRDLLGSAEQVPCGREGETLMVGEVQYSESEEDFRRASTILRINENSVSEIIRAYLAGHRESEQSE